MPIGSDFSIDYTNRRIYHSNGTTVYSVRELYSWLMMEFDDTGTIDDTIPMTSQTPTAYTLVNGWFINFNYTSSYQYLTGGAIKTTGWDAKNPGGYSNGIRMLTFTANPNTIATDIGKTVTGGITGHTGTLLDYDNTARKWWVRVSGLSATFNQSETVSVSSGTGSGTTSGASVTGENLWTNLYTLGTLESGTQLYVYQNGTAIPSWWSTGHIDVLLLVKSAGTEIDVGNLTIFARQFNKLYDHTVIDAGDGGRIPAPLATFPDTNNTTSSVTVAGYSDISISFGSFSHDLNNGNGAQPYDVDINCAGRTVAQVYEYLKYVTRQGETTTLNSIPGEAYISANGLYNPVKAAPFGTFAGGRFFGARGVYLYNMAAADANKYELIDANGVLQAPPQSITLTVTGLAVNDQVAVFRATGDNNIIDKTIFTIYDAHSAGSGEIRVASGPGNPIPNDTPSTGYIRVVQRNASGKIVDEQKWPYVSWNNTNQASGWSTFVLSGTTGAYTYDTTATAYVPYIDVTADATSESVSLIYVTDRYLTARVRKSGILPFMAKYQITNTNLTITAVRATDPILP